MWGAAAAPRLVGFLHGRGSTAAVPAATFDVAHLLWYAGALIVMGAMGLFTTLAFSQMGGRALTLAGLAGLGDLVLTCTGDLSRNRKVGLALARGDALADILSRLGHIAEGVGTARIARDLADRLGVDMPITREVAAVLHDGKPPRAAVNDLLARDIGAER